MFPETRSGAVAARSVGERGVTSAVVPAAGDGWNGSAASAGVTMREGAMPRRNTDETDVDVGKRVGRRWPVAWTVAAPKASASASISGFYVNRHRCCEIGPVQFRRTVAPPMIAVEAYTDLSAVDGLRDRWSRLWSLTPGATFAQTFDCFRAEVGARGVRPRVFAASVSGRLIGLWPMLERTGRTRLGRRRVVLTADGMSPGPVGPCAAATAAVVARHLAGDCDWDEITCPELDGLPGRSLEISSAFAAAGLGARFTPTCALGEIRLGGRWTDVLGVCDEKTRLAAYRAMHCADPGAYRFDRFRPAAGAAPLKEIREAIAVDGVLRPIDRAVVEAVMSEAARRGAADIALLRHEGRAVAASLSFVGAAGIENRLAAVAADAPPAAGVRLLLELFRDSSARGDRRYVFAATPGHPAIGWAGRVTPRRNVHIAAHGGARSRLQGIGHALRTACGIAPAAGAV